MSTIINITKEVIESQHLGDGFSICVENNGRITIEPNKIDGDIIMHQTNQNEDDLINNDPVLKDWNDAAPHLVTKQNDDWTW